MQYSPIPVWKQSLLRGSALNPPKQNVGGVKPFGGKNNFQPLLLVFSYCVPKGGVNKILPWMMSFNSQSAKWSFFNALFQGSIIIYTSYSPSAGPVLPLTKVTYVLIYNNQYLIRIIHPLWQTNQCMSFSPTPTRVRACCNSMRKQGLVLWKTAPWTHILFIASREGVENTNRHPMELLREVAPIHNNPCAQFCLVSVLFCF